ncbi:DNA mismatch endonuclease Vsr [Mesorhizobium sp. BE184]|uniref:very short patch repair endonuclease n=1 Tax=Mesorhizobium sp. BE184 TaxID=2817714 RepID=UPI00286B3B1F|nr:DNA mismatch endonuclease Vsr [Mesorhizobium sp. BE184]
MADRISKAQRSANMRKIKGKDTAPELVVRRAVHGLGFRYRLHRRDLPGNPDLVFGPRRKVIFVHGCFWHQHSDCRAGRIPEANATYWKPKLQRTIERDRRNIAALEDAGWRVLVLWECEITTSTTAIEQILRHFLGEAGAK